MKINVIYFVLLWCFFSDCKMSNDGNEKKSKKNDTYYFGAQNHALTGTIHKKTEYGPPNYGDDTTKDAKIKIFILELQHDINVFPNSQNKSDLDADSFFNVHNMQLTMLKRIDFEKYVDKVCSVEGELFEKHTGHHFTDVLMTVNSIKLAETK